MKEYGKRLRLSEEEVEMVYENRAESTTNTNGNTALDITSSTTTFDTPALTASVLKFLTHVLNSELLEKA